MAALDRFHYSRIISNRYTNPNKEVLCCVWLVGEGLIMIADPSMDQHYQTIELNEVFKLVITCVT